MASPRSDPVEGPTIKCGQCRAAIPPEMETLLDHARGHALSVSGCFPLELSDETRLYIRQLR